MPTYLTQYLHPDGLYAGEDIDAPSRDIAEHICEQRGLDEEVIGELVAWFPAGMDFDGVEKANKLCEAYATNGTVEAEDSQ